MVLMELLDLLVNASAGISNLTRLMWPLSMSVI